MANRLDMGTIPETNPALPGPERVSLVRQKHRKGCAIACLAMITGLDYDHIGTELSELNWKADGLTSRESDKFLHEHGYSVCRIYPTHANGKLRSEWPVLFAEIHTAKVFTPEAHNVVVLRDGTVLDPNCDEPKRLSDYEGVHSVAGVYRVK